MVRRRDWLMVSDLAPCPIGNCASTILVAHHTRRSRVPVAHRSGDPGQAEAGWRAAGQRSGRGRPHRAARRAVRKHGGPVIIMRGAEPGSRGAWAQGAGPFPFRVPGTAVTLCGSELDHRLNGQTARLAHVFGFETPPFDRGNRPLRPTPKEPFAVIEA